MLTKDLGPEHNLEPYVGLNIELSSYAPDEFTRLFRRSAHSVLDVDSRAIHLRDDDKVSIPFDSTEPYLTDGAYLGHDGQHLYYWSWGSKDDSWSTGDGTHRVTKSEIDSQLRSLGLRSLAEFAEQVVGLPWANSNSLEILMPVQISVHVQQSVGTVKVSGSAPAAIAPFELELEVYAHSHGTYVRHGQVRRPDITFAEPVDRRIQFEASVDVTDRPSPSTAELTLFKRQPGRVELWRHRVALPSGDPLFDTFTEFVPAEEITEYLASLVKGTGVRDSSAYKRYSKVTKRDIDGLLEHVTAMLMSLCGLNPLPLAEIQHDSLPGDPTSGGADILGISESGVPLLVACTMAAPSEHDVSLLEAARLSINARSPSNQIPHHLVLVSGKPAATMSSQKVIVLSASSLTSVWDLICLGDKTGARAIFGIESPGIAL
ncbi:MAG: hypothetical protein IIC95_05370 [Chloroflexi bacterium]|nr:hypothetical protein [Chloroflexota bacterium]